MSKITEIQYLESTSLTNLQALVNDCITRGWQPFGAVVYYEIAVYMTNCVQAVVKYEDIPSFYKSYNEVLQGASCEDVHNACPYNSPVDGELFKTVSNPGWEGIVE